jgi:hypothetical protein
MPTKKQELGEKLKEKFGIKYRRSPEGIREFIIPQGIQQSLFFANNPHAQAYSLKLPLMAPMNVYKEQRIDPETETHERIHAGQQLLENQPTLEQLESIFGKRAPGRYNVRHPIMEIPAYNLSSPVEDSYNKFLQNLPRVREGGFKRVVTPSDLIEIQEQQAKYNQYMNLLEDLNLGNIEAAESPMPETFKRRRMMNWPEKRDPNFLPRLPRPQIIR